MHRIHAVLGFPQVSRTKKNRKKTKKIITAAVFVVAAAAVQNKKKFDSHANRLDFWLDFATKCAKFMQISQSES